MANTVDTILEVAGVASAGIGGRFAWLTGKPKPVAYRIVNIND